MADRADSQTATVQLRIGDRVFPIEPDRIHVIGSGPRADLRIDDDGIATAHATFCVHDGRLILEDLGSPGGTWVGPVRIRGECELQPGTGIRLGPVECIVESVVAPAAAPGDPPPPSRAGSAAALPLRSGEPTFRDLVADELRRAPWFALSLALHALIFLVLWLLVPAPSFGSSEPPRIAIGADTTPRRLDDTSTPEPPEPEARDPADDPLPLANEDADAFEAPAAPVPEPASAAPNSSLADSLAELGSLLGTPLRAGGRDILTGAGAGRLSDGFRRTVQGLRASGLEIVFVVDSTGSMGPVLDGTRRRMVRMLEALRALVPDARVGITTYRDRGSREDYVVRSLTLGADFYRTLTFMETVEAGGGGDRPEAVLEGIQRAVGQPWRDGSRRVIVLIGDAPAHPYSMRELLQTVRRFVADGRSTVHAIMTAPDVFRGIEGDTRASFETIAQAGRGLSVPFEREERILDQVLALAIGHEFRDAVAEVFTVLERDRGRAADAQVALRQIWRELRKPRLDDRFVESLAADGSREVAEELIRVLASAEIPRGGRHAASWALQRLLRLRRPPLEPAEDGPIDADLAESLRVRALTLPAREELSDPESDRSGRRSPARDGKRSGDGAPSRVRDRRRG